MDAPPEEVWALVSDVTRIGEFSPETFEARWTRGSTGPEVGAYFKGHVKRNGVGPTYWSPCKVTECVPERGLRVRRSSIDGPMTPVNNWGYRLEPEGDGTAGHGVLPARAVAADAASTGLVLGAAARAHQPTGHADDAGADEGGGGGVT